MKYTDPKSKITISSNNSEAGNRFLSDYVKACLECQKKEEEWFDLLYSQRIKAAHPDDGWNNREEKEIFLAYPYFNDGVQIGDKIALGDYRKYHIVKVIGIKRSIMSQTYYQYKEI